MNKYEILREKALLKLEQRNRRGAFVIKHRFGIGTGNPMTLLEVGNLMRPKLIRKRVRQIEIDALEQLFFILRELDREENKND